MGTTSSFFGGSSGGATAAATITSQPRFSRLDFLATTSNISGQSGYTTGGPYLVGMNDTHFVAHYINTNNGDYWARLFRVNDDYSVSTVGSWVNIISSSPQDLDGIHAGNGYRSVYLGTNQGGTNKMFRFDWDGGTGTSKSQRISIAGSNNGINNASCLIDGTLVGQLHSSSGSGRIYYCSDTLSGTQKTGDYGSSFNDSASLCGSVGMENTINSVGRTSTQTGNYYTLYRGNNGNLAMNDVDIGWNQSHTYQPNQFRIARSGNAVVVAMQSTEVNRYGATMIEGYANGNTDGSSFQWHRVNSNYGYTAGYGYGSQNQKSNPCSDVQKGSFCRQYNGTYLDNRWIVDFGEDTRFRVSYPFKNLQHQSSTANHDSALGQCIIGDKLIQCHKFGTTQGSWTYEFDVWKLT